MAKYQEIASLLKEEITSGKFEGKLPTEYELVSRFSVSRQTVRQAISCLKSEGWLYQVQGSGTYISKPSVKKSAGSDGVRRVMVICTYISDYIFPSIIRGIERKLSDAGITVSIAATGNRVDVERRILQNIIDTEDADGIIVEGTKTGFPSPNISLYRQIKEMGIPVIFLHCSYPELDDAVVVGMKDREGGLYIADCLIKKGCRKFGAIFKSDDRQGLLRYAGFCEGIIASGLSLDQVKIRWYTTEDGEEADSGKADGIAAEFEGLDALVCYNDQVAAAAVQAGVTASFIASFDNSMLCQAYRDRIYSIGHRKDELGEEAAIRMISMLDGKKAESVFLDWIYTSSSMP
ncbi:MAG: GntR family transcriptional regulator [Bullifex sp.]